MQVKSNPLFATMCGFTEKIPSYRSFARFDQIMTTKGLWEKARLLVVEYNKGEGVVETNEEAAAVDTSHIEAEATLNKTRKWWHRSIHGTVKINQLPPGGLKKSTGTALPSVSVDIKWNLEDLIGKRGNIFTLVLYFIQMPSKKVSPAR
ncbi:hypothetical protein RP319_02590 [Heyndrickxia coagulans]|uniref:hypothetical protein n=1 Tax=Heyndrickxia coagulans TaxID=1398 RepID=UPI0028F97136|nr:hypothetical protein [Heyndrickxia coagulans]MDT9755074.1 hypothetical protein [Heyndrickxia coagulans]